MIAGLVNESNINNNITNIKASEIINQRTVAEISAAFSSHSPTGSLTTHSGSWRVATKFSNLFWRVVHCVVNQSARSDSTLTLTFPFSLLICATAASGCISMRSQIRTFSPRGVVIVRFAMPSGVTTSANVSKSTFIALSSPSIFMLPAHTPLIAPATSLAACDWLSHTKESLSKSKELFSYQKLNS